MNGNSQLVGSTPVDVLTPTGGMHYTEAAHLVPPTGWRTQRNMRSYGGRLWQLLRRYATAQLPAPSEPVLNLANVPTGVADCGLWLAFTPTRVLQWRQGSASQTELKAGLVNCGMPWSTYVHNDCVFFVNDANPVRYCDGQAVWDLWHGFSSVTIDSTCDEDLQEQYPAGPFTLEPFFTWDEVLGKVPTGFLTPTFTWTANTLYRVYVQTVRKFPLGCEISVSNVGVILQGVVVAQKQRYLVVRAISTQAGINNWTNQWPWVVTIREMYTLPTGRYCTIFFDHCVVAAPPRNRSLVMWSDLYNYMSWKPATGNEADSRCCTDYQRSDDLVAGVTGLQHFRDRLLIFTPSCVYVMTYTGLPRIVKVDPLIQDYGNGLPYATAALDDRVVWCDVHHRSFYAWRGQGVEEFGGPIADWFFGRLSTVTAYAIKTRAFVDRANHEVAWWYVSSAATDLDEAIVYNWADNTWHVQTLDGGEQCFGRVYKRAKTVAQFGSTQVDSVSTGIDAAEQSGEVLGAVFGATAGRVLTDGTEEDGSSVAQEQPLLETGDLLYGSATTVKEVSAMTLQVSGTFKAIKVEIAARERLADEVSFVEVGLWTNSLPTRHLTFKPRAGKVLRYRFTADAAAENVRFSGYTANVTNAAAIR